MTQPGCWWWKCSAEQMLGEGGFWCPELTGFLGWSSAWGCSLKLGGCTWPPNSGKHFSDASVAGEPHTACPDPCYQGRGDEWGSQHKLLNGQDSWLETANRAPWGSPGEQTNLVHMFHPSPISFKCSRQAWMGLEATCSSGRCPMAGGLGLDDLWCPT